MQLQTKSFDKTRSKIQSVYLAAQLVPTAKFKDLPKAYHFIRRTNIQHINNLIATICFSMKQSEFLYRDCVEKTKIRFLRI